LRYKETHERDAPSDESGGAFDDHFDDLFGFIGEYGVPDSDPRWLTVLDTFLAYLDANGVGGTYWAGGCGGVATRSRSSRTTARLSPRCRS